MGAVNFSLDVKLADVLKTNLGLEAFVETGTFRGETVDALKDMFHRIYTIELSQEYYTQAVSKFEGLEHIQVLHGDSAQELKQVAADLSDVSALYFLDAHWCVADDTAGEISQCPLLAELDAVGSLNATSIIIIDDARLFLAPPLAPHEISQWPSFHELSLQLQALSGYHRLMVLNDTIIFYPEAAHAVVNEYAKQHGVDWLAMMHANRDYENLRIQFEGLQSQVEDKDARMTELQSQVEDKDARMTELQSQVEDKDARMTELQSQVEDKDVRIELLFDELVAKEKWIRNHRHCMPAMHWCKNVIGRVRVVNRIKGLLTPKLGQLFQYPPRDLVFSEYDCSPKKDLSDWPSISIVTPSFGQGHFIERTMKSVLEQEYPNLEYFVQDGGSKDETVQVLKSYADQLDGWVSEPDSGQSQAINRGMKKTTGEIMAWLNSDDLLLPGTLAYVAAYFAQHPEVDVVYGHRLIIDGNDMEIGKWIMPAHDDEVLSWGDYIPQETLFWRRCIWEKAGGNIDEEFRFAMDWDLLLRLRDAGAKFKCLPKFLGAFRVHSEQKTSANIHDVGMHEMDILRQRVLGRSPSHAEIRKGLLMLMIKHTITHLAFMIRKKAGWR